MTILFRKKTLDVRNRNQTTRCQYKIKIRQLVKHYYTVLTDVPSLSCMDVCELTFSWFSAWWSRESLNLQLLSRGTWLSTSGSRNGVLTIFAKTGDLPRPDIILSYLSLLNFSTHLMLEVCTWGDFWYWVWKYLLQFVIDCIWTY